MRLLLITIFALLSLNVLSQIKHKRKVPSYFGIRISPIFPTQFIGDKSLSIEQASNDPFKITSTITQTLGYSFGGTVRAGLTKLLALETGINYNVRNFDVTMSLPDSAITADNHLTFVQYDIPINALFYIQLDDNIYMDASLGIALTYTPTNIGSVIKPANRHVFYNSGFVKNKIGLDINANLGFELRTEKSGFFYIGGSARVPFKPLFDYYLTYEYNTSSVVKEISGPVDGSFLAIEFKYFFPIIKNKGTQFQKGPIEQ